jgi:hypothetical protein
MVLTGIDLSHKFPLGQKLNWLRVAYFDSMPTPEIVLLLSNKDNKP